MEIASMQGLVSKDKKVKGGKEKKYFFKCDKNGCSKMAQPIKNDL